MSADKEDLGCLVVDLLNAEMTQVQEATELELRLRSNAVSTATIVLTSSAAASSRMREDLPFIPLAKPIDPNMLAAVLNTVRQADSSIRLNP
jgi:hypothetical protein